MTDPGLHMDTAGTTDAMGTLASAEAAVSQAWTTARASIDGLGGQLGQGDLGAAFMSGYRPAVTMVDQTINQTTAAGLKLAQVGHQSIADYVRVDNLAASSFALPHH